MNNKVKCIYTGEPLTEKNLSIDHYLPWSFLAHDREWNLIPVDKNINSSKNNKLPSWKYFENFVNLKKKRFEAANSFRKYDSYLQNYIIDLEVQNWRTIKIEELKTKYEKIFTALF